MSQQPTTLTDQLANVIQVIQLGRKTGTLTVERGTGSNLERGSIHFVNGLMTRASAQQLKGLPAFQWLNTWGTCHFNFTPSDLGVTTSKLPSMRPSQFPVSEHQSIHDTGTGQHLQAQVKTLPDSATQNNQARQNNLSMQKESIGIPKQVCIIEDAVQRIEHMKLSRTHRRLFLLIDGHRNTADLARLMGRRQVEVVALLQDLERADIVKH